MNSYQQINKKLNEHKTQFNKNKSNTKIWIEYQWVFLNKSKRSKSYKLGNKDKYKNMNKCKRTIHKLAYNVNKWLRNSN